MAQALSINEVFRHNRYPTILAGDLNDTPESRAINILEEQWTATYNKHDPQPTFPSDKPAKKIDYVMYLKAKNWQVLDRQVVCDTIASDHCAYLVTLELTK